MWGASQWGKPWWGWSPDGTVLYVSTPPYRVALILAEDRTVTVGAEARGILLLAEDRTVPVSDEARLAIVAAEDRTATIYPL